MSDRSETEAYLAAELDSLQRAHAAGDQATVTRRIEHVHAEAGPETAAVLEQMLKEKEQEVPISPPAQPAFTPTSLPDGVPPRSRRFVVGFLAAAVVMLLLVVAVLVTVVVVRPSTTTTAPPPPQAPGRPAGTTTTPPASSPTNTTIVPPPVAPSEQTWIPVWPETKRITIPGDSTMYGYSVDLEIPQVEEGLGADLHYNVSKLEKYLVKLMGIGPDTLPAPEDCLSAAKTQPADHAFAAADMIPGKTAWCIVTRNERLVWLHLLSGGGELGASTLRFELMQWRKTG